MAPKDYLNRQFGIVLGFDTSDTEHGSTQPANCTKSDHVELKARDCPVPLPGYLDAYATLEFAGSKINRKTWKGE